MPEQPEPMSDDEHTIRWYAVTHQPEWNITVGEYARQQFASIMGQVMDAKTPLDAIPALRKLGEAWSEIMAWPQKFEAEMDELKAAQSRAAHSSNAPDADLVGAKAEDQWYEK